MFQLFFLQPRLKTPFRSLDKRVRNVCPKNLVPDGKEWLGVVEFQAIELMMDVMVGGIVLKKQMEEITRQPQPTVVINGFD